MHPLNHTIVAEKFSPFLPMGFQGLISAMGYSFIALHGFDLIAAVAGEIKDPQRNIPRAMLLSLSTALCIYIPLLVVVTVVGADPGESVIQLSAKNPVTIIARAAGRYLGVPGYWTEFRKPFFPLIPVAWGWHTCPWLLFRASMFLRPA